MEPATTLAVAGSQIEMGVHVAVVNICGINRSLANKRIEPYDERAAGLSRLMRDVLSKSIPPAIYLAIASGTL